MIKRKCKVYFSDFSFRGESDNDPHIFRQFSAFAKGFFQLEKILENLDPKHFMYDIVAKNNFLRLRFVPTFFQNLPNREFHQ